MHTIRRQSDIQYIQYRIKRVVLLWIIRQISFALCDYNGDYQRATSADEVTENTRAGRKGVKSAFQFSIFNRNSSKRKMGREEYHVVQPTEKWFYTRVRYVYIYIYVCVRNVCISRASTVSFNNSHPLPIICPPRILLLTRAYVYRNK